jgi:hypothetical protein
MRSDRSPGAWSGSEFSGWYVDAVNGLVGAGFARAAPEPLHGGEDGQGLTRLLSYAPSSPLRKEEGGGEAPCCPRRAPNMVSPLSC